MFPHIADLYRRNPRRAVAELMHVLPPDDPKYAKPKKRLEALEYGFALFPEEDELAEIDRFTKADVLEAWKLAPPAITKAEWIFFCQRLFHPQVRPEMFHPQLRQEVSGMMLRTQGLFLYRQSPLVKGLGLYVLTLVEVEHREIVEAGATAGYSEPRVFFRIASARRP